MADTDGMAIACERIAKEQTERTGFLNLGHLALTALPEELGTLTHLKVLNLGSSWIDQEGNRRFHGVTEDANRLAAADWTFLKRLQRLESLAVADCAIGDIQPLVAAPSLRHLIVDDNPLPDLAALFNLQALQSLACSRTQVSDLSALSSLQELQSLACSRTQVSDLHALSSLQALQSLDFSGTKVSDLSALSNLEMLESLDCSGTHVSDLSVLSNLKGLRLLACWGTQVSDLCALSNLEMLESLDCSGTQVSDLSALSDLKGLRSLACWGTRVSDLSALSNLQALESLDFSGTKVSDLSALSNLQGLVLLDCSATQVNDLSALSNLQTLKSLNFSGTEVSDLSALSNFSALESLNFWHTQVSDLSALSNLQALESLDFSATQVSDLSALSSLQTLKSLYCWRTQVRDLSALSNLPALKSLYCSSTPVSDLSGLSNLPALESLYCSRTQVSDLSALSNSQTLESLDCSETNVSDLSPLSNLPALQSLDCSRTQVSDLGVLPKMPALRRLSACGIPINRIPERLVFKPELKSLQLLDVPGTGIPAEVLSKDTHTSCLEELRSHFRDLQKGAVPLPDMKIMVLGNGRIGKTQICRRLRGESYEEDADSTHGIIVTSTKLSGEGTDDGEILLHLWDFGGQDIYHGTHALFMQSRAIFFAVWTPESEDRKEHEHRGIRFRNHRLDYWLELIRQFGSANSPVLLIQTRCDKVEDELRRAPAPDELLDEFGFCKLLHYSARENRGRATLDEALSDAVRWVRERQGHATIGIGRLKVRRRLEKLRQDDAALPPSDRKHRVISRTFFAQLCEEEGGTSNPEHLLAYLHECGVIFYRPGIFADTIILDQEWALEAIYTVFNREKCWRQLRQLNGRFTQSLLATLVWHEYEEGEQALFIDLMVSAGICFVHREADPRAHTETEYIAPDLLPEVSEVEEEIGAFWQDEPGEEQVLDFPFEHPGLIRGVIARIGRGAGMNAVYWKGGVCGFERRTHSAIRIDTVPPESEDSYSLRIKIRTQRGRAKDLLAQAVEWIEEEARTSGCQPVDSAARREPKAPVRKHSRDHRDDKAGELGKTPLSEKPDFGPPPRKAQRTYCVSYAWTKESSDFVDQLCERARIGGVDVIRDKTHLGLGERISKFMRRLGAGDRVFVILSEKYLHSPFCMYELLEVWRQSREEEDQFLQRIRVYRLPDVKIGTPVERMKVAIFWREQFEELNALVKQHGADLLGADDFRRYKLMRDFAFHVGDILGLVMDTLQPQTLEEFEKFSFELEPVVP